MGLPRRFWRSGFPRQFVSSTRIRLAVQHRLPEADRLKSLSGTSRL